MAHTKRKVYDNDWMKASTISFGVTLLLLFSTFLYSSYKSPEAIYSKNSNEEDLSLEESSTPVLAPLNTKLYDEKLLELANLPPNTATSSATTTPKVSLWPVRAPYPLAGALLPFNRIVAYYGNFYSTKMGVLGEYPPDVMLSKLQDEVRAWKTADPYTPVIPAIHYIVAVAQADAGADGDYLARMPDEHIQKAVDLAKEVKGIVFLDIQFGYSTVEKEVEAVLPYLSLPTVHLGLDPEFALEEGKKPGHYIGSLDASEINRAIEILSKVVKENNLPPKILIIHRFTEKMVTNYKEIKPTPEVQVVINMDGWGTPELKTGIYRQIVRNEPVQFAGIKLFYKNDLRAPSTRLLIPEEILKWSPIPSYVQYQ